MTPGLPMTWPASVRCTGWLGRFRETPKKNLQKSQNSSCIRVARGYIKPMKANQLIELAAAKNLGISRKAPGTYEMHQVIDGKHITTEFVGTWAQFVKHIKSL